MVLRPERNRAEWPSGVSKLFLYYGTGKLSGYFVFFPLFDYPESSTGGNFALGLKALATVLTTLHVNTQTPTPTHAHNYTHTHTHTGVRLWKML